MMTNVATRHDTLSVSKSFQVWTFDKNELSFIGGESDVKIGYDFSNVEESFYLIEGINVSADLKLLNQHYFQYKEEQYLQGDIVDVEEESLSHYLNSFKKDITMQPLNTVIFEDSIVFNAETKKFTKASEILGIRVKCMIKKTYDYREIILPVYTTVEWNEMSVYNTSLEVVNSIHLHLTTDRRFLVTLEQSECCVNKGVKGMLMGLKELEEQFSFLTLPQMCSFKKRLKDFCRPFNMDFSIFMVKYGKDILHGYEDTKSMIEEMELLYQSEIVLNESMAKETVSKFKHYFEEII